MPFRSLAAIVLACTWFASCNVNSGEEARADSAEALRKNRAQKKKWAARDISRYRYSLSYRESLLSRDYRGACRIDADTSFCDLVRTDELGEVSGRLQMRGLTMDDFFAKIDSLIDETPPPGILPMPDPVLDTVSIGRDTLLFAVAFPDSTQESGVSWPSGVSVAYDSARGFPRALRRLPLGPDYELSDFVELPEE